MTVSTTQRATTAPTRRRLVVAALTPLAAWSAAFLLSYVIQDFICAAAHSADQAVPATTVRVILVGLNAVLLLVTLGAGALGWSWWRRFRRQDRPGVERFLALITIVAAVLFAFSIVLIGINPLFLEVCT